MTDHPCPRCGHDPTAESLAEQHLSDLGYTHDDRFLQCSSCDNQWTVGVPIGQYGGDEWRCGCGGNFMPHFIYVRDETLEVRPKCQSCYHVPDEPIVLDLQETGNCERAFISHHTVTGDRTDAEPNTFN